jgi:gliding motility-associated lipoprotein GldH
MRRTFLSLILLSIASIYSCNSVVFEDIKEINENYWTNKDSAVFNLKIKDTKQIFNVFIDIENTDNFKYSNLFLFVKIESPDKKTIIDTIDVFMADYKGKWVGSKKGDNYYGKYLFKKAIIFPLSGVYKTTIIQGMREDTLIGITKIGISVKQIN